MVATGAVTVMAIVVVTDMDTVTVLPFMLHLPFMAIRQQPGMVTAMGFNPDLDWDMAGATAEDMAVMVTVPLGLA